MFNKLLSTDATVCSEEAIGNLKTDLCSLFAWSKEWQMLFNIDKCKVMHLGYNNPSADYFYGFCAVTGSQ